MKRTCQPPNTASNANTIPKTNKVLTRLVLACWFAAAGLVTETGAMPKPVAGQAKAEIVLGKTQYAFGEPFRVEFVLRNTDDKELSLTSGGDYRGVNRALRFRIQMLDANGEAAPCAEPPRMFMGGLSGMTTLQPGGEWRQPLWPLDYLRLTQPGRYTLRITHDLGWTKQDFFHHLMDETASASFVPADWPAPVAEASVEFTVPDARQAERILESVASELKKEKDAIIPSTRDFGFPVYVPLLKKHALAGEPFFLQALGENQTKEATLALLDLAEDKNFTDAAVAAHLLTRRLEEATWDAQNTPRVRAIAHALVESFNPKMPGQKPRGVGATGYFRTMVASEFKEVDTGARMLAAVGTTEDYGVLRAALEKAFDLTISPRTGPDVNILDLPAPMEDLIRALDALHTRGIDLQDGALSGDAEIFLYFHWLEKTPPPRSPRWLESAKAFNAPNRYPTQIAISKSIPTPMPPQCRDLVLDLLNAKDYGVLRAACQVAGQSGDTTFLPAVLSIVRIEHNTWLFNDACSAARQLGGAKLELVRAVSERLTDENLGVDALRFLIGQLMDEKQSGRYDFRSDATRQVRIARQEAWRKWISEHAEDINAGKKFSPDNMPTALFE